MHSYLYLLENIYRDGTTKHPSRAESGKTKNATRGLADLLFQHELKKGFPLLTTRTVPFKAVAGELRSFLLGHTKNQQFIDNGCKFWTPWANNLHDRHVINPDTDQVFEKGDLGRIYGYQWNRNGQLHHVLDCLRNRPTDRRMVVSSWNAADFKLMALQPCHYEWCVTPYDGKLNLKWSQRSCDFPIGVPCNIASYALLAHLLAKWAGLAVGKLTSVFSDAHIYENQLEGVKEQISRKPRGLPNIEVWFADKNDFHSWDYQLAGYKPKTKIDFGEVEV